MIGYGLANFKSFHQKVQIDLRPVTLLFGYNSAGKSSILRALPFLRDAVIQRQGGPLPLKSEAIRGASFEDLRCKTASQPKITFEMKFEGSIGVYQVQIRDIPEHKRQVVENAVVLNSEGAKVLVLDWVPSDAGLGQPYETYACTTFQEKGPRETTLEIDFIGLVPNVKFRRPEKIFAINIIEQLQRALVRSAENIYWLKALRCVPPRHEMFGNLPERMSPDGSGASQILAYNDLQSGDVVRDVASWYKRATGSVLELKKGAFLGTDLISVTLTPSDFAGGGVALTDTGEGMGQVLPIVTLLALAKHHKLGEKVVLAIEHPELHLHPSAHPSLADMFCEAASVEIPPSIVVETHSENFLLAVQLSIIEGRIPASSVVIYWVRHRNDTAVAEKIEFDELGRPKGDNWPPGLFNESTEQSRRVVLARRNLQRQ